MHTHPIAKDMKLWWEEHALNHKSDQWQSYLRYYGEAVKNKLIEQSVAHDNKGLFGMSRASGCTRSSALSLLGADKVLSGDSKFTFAIGHSIECMAIATLQAMGYRVSSTQEPVVIEGIMRSAVDGIISNGPRPDIPYPCILSVKSIGYKFSKYNKNHEKILRQGFCALPFEGVTKGQVSWWCQSQAEMLATGIDRTLIVAVAKDIILAMKNDPYMQESGSMSFYCELLMPNPTYQKLLTKTWAEQMESVKIGKAGKPLYYTSNGEYVELPSPADVDNGWNGPNQEATGTFNPCMGCMFVEDCGSGKFD